MKLVKFYFTTFLVLILVCFYTTDVNGQCADI